MATRKKAVARRGNTAPVSAADLIQQQLQQNQELQVSNSNVIGTSDKMFQFPDGSQTPGPIELIVIDYTFQNRFYATAYNSNNLTPPDCFAIAENKQEKGMTPLAAVPNPEAAGCDECPNNEFGSRNDGKACSNTMLLAVKKPGDPDGTLMTIRASATALKGAKGYIRSLSALHGQVPVQRVTEFSFHPDKSYPTLILQDAGENLDWEAYLTSSHAEAALLLKEEPSFDPPAQAAPKKKTAARRGTRGRRAA